MAQFNVTELDFDKIKASIKDHFVSQTKYTDWAFDGSGLNVLLDVLAYNTHYNAMVSHFSMNETFLDSAQIRGNVVSHAKLLGYTPRSTIASRATLNVTVEAGANPPPFLTLERGFRFRSTVNEKPYTFLILDPQQAVLNTTDLSTYPNGRYVFNAVPILQGTLKRMLYVVDNSVQNQKFVIPDQNVDTTTLRVQVKTNTQSNDYAAYAKFTTLSGVDPTSTIYFLQENSSGNYEIYFGDGILGKKPISNNIVEIEYIYTDGEVTNGATTFETVDGVSGMIVQPPVTVTKSYGASARESIDSIRYNAPFTFVSQNRAVTSDDYRSIIQNNFGNIEAISVWGGEDAPAPDYGTVYISIKKSGEGAAKQAALAAHGLAVVDVEPVPTQGGSLRVYVRHATSVREGDVAPAVAAAMPAAALAKNPLRAGDRGGLVFASVSAAGDFTAWVVMCSPGWMKRGVCSESLPIFMSVRIDHNQRKPFIW